MNWYEISKGTPEGRTLAQRLLTDADRMVPVDTGSRVVNIDVNVESAYSGATSVYRVFPNGAVDKGVEEKAARAASSVEYFVVLTVEFLSDGALVTETLDEPVEIQQGDDAEALYFRAWVLFREQYNVGSHPKVLCWSFHKNQLD